jgi:RNA polymerase sigma factor (sigma-70 family)
VNRSDAADAEIVAAARLGDGDAFGILLRRYQNPIYRFVRGQIGDADEAMDLVQEVFVSAHGALHRYDPTRSLRTWLLAIALNKCRDWARRRKVRAFFARALPIGNDAVGIAADRPGPDIEAADRQALDLAWRAIADLPASLKEPLVLTTIDGLSQGEAAQLLGISTKAVETRVARARATLREALRVDGG